jgi:hypothetical protein
LVEGWGLYDQGGYSLFGAARIASMALIDKEYFSMDCLGLPCRA